jgi:hypothetical protein
MKTRFASKMNMFEALKFENAIILCYEQQQTMALQHRVFKAEVWAIAKTLTCILNLVITTCVMNQS